MSLSPSGGHRYSLHHTFGDVDVLHGDKRCQFIQTVDVLDFIHELHTEEDSRETIAAEATLQCEFMDFKAKSNQETKQNMKTGKQNGYFQLCHKSLCAPSENSYECNWIF